MKFFVNDIWCFMKRDVNIRNFTISYMREGGFAKKELTDTAKKNGGCKISERPDIIDLENENLSPFAIF